MRNFCFLLITLTMVGCSDSEWLSIEMPDTAIDQYQGHPFSDYSRQTSYTHTKKYPDESVIKGIGATLGKEWNRCKYGHGIWHDFEDRAGDKPRHVYQRIQTWRTEDERRLLFIALRHETEPCKSSACSAGDSKQSVSIIEHGRPLWLFWENFDELCEGQKTK